MRKIIIERREAPLKEEYRDIDIYVNAKLVGTIKKEELKKEFKLFNGSQVVVACFVGEDQKDCRSNAYFLTGSKNEHAYLVVSGTRINLFEN
ncbi:MAG: hypothetical protein K6G38_04350 [Gammaproteobacteria bacterium]|nr:hypothetical protein [Gammaproteobacteria bacterium]